MNTLNLIAISLCSWLIIAVLAASPMGARLFRLLLSLSACISLVILVASVFALFQSPNTMTLPLGVPGFSWQWHLDPLSSFFLILLGTGSFSSSLFAISYFKSLPDRSKRAVLCELQLFLLGMASVFLADDVYSFMLSWELMAVSSYLLILSEQQNASHRQTAFLYLLIAHISALAILVSLLILSVHSGMSFESMRQAPLSPALASTVFLLALLGFGAKAGLVPLHIWLPEAHPAAPSPISALMSGVMLKTAIYGLLRVTFCLLPVQYSWWGILALALGLFSAIYGVIFATVQNDIKRLLAFSSIENLAIVIAAIGLGIIFAAYGKTTMAAIALLACLYHCFNHLCYKSLLFLGAGQILHSTGQRDMNKLGGLIHQMPWLAIAMLVGILAASGLPPLNGFVSEWLLLQAFLFFPNLPTPYLTMLVPIGAALLILAAALSGYAMVKCYGISFLGRPRHTLAQQPHDLDKLGRLALGLLALLCIVFGVLPFLMVKILMNPISDLLKQPFSSEHFLSGWLFLAPVAADRASYSPLLFFCAIGIAIALVSVIIYYLFHGKLRRAAAWDCGFAEQTPRMQDTADGFAQPVEHIFNAFFDSERTLPAATDNTPRYQLLIQDRFWKWLYLPVAHSTKRLSDLVGKIQQGKIGIYLLYGFLTLIILLLMI